jgi:hypothetical protein
MSISATCPGCGVTLSLNENETAITCPYCNTHFNVKLDQTSPTLEKSQPPAPPAPDTYVPSPEDVITPPQPAQTSAPDAGFFNPPIPGEPPVSPADVYNPPISGQTPMDVYNPPLSSGGQAYPPPPFTQPTGSLTSRISGRGLWLTIGITTFVVFCISCLCLLAVVRSFGN